jgi:hypothetical protein
VPMRVYRNHNCTKKHRSYTAMAKCVWRGRFATGYPTGEGPYASVSYCADRSELPSYRRGVVVYLYELLSQAEAASRLIDETACGGNCIRRHELVHLQLS